MASQKQRKTFSMGASVLLTCFASVALIVHAFMGMMAHASGFFLFLAAVISGGYLYVDWVQYWTTFWATEEKEDKGVAYTAFVASAVLSLVMAISGGAVLIYYVVQDKDSKLALTQKETAKLQNENEIAAQRERMKSRMEADQKFALSIQQQRAAGMPASVLNRQIEARRKQLESEALAEQAAKPMAFDSLLPKAPEAPAQTNNADIGERFLKVLTSYAEFWVLFVPTLLAILAKYSVTFAQMRPGGATTTHTSSGKAAPGSRVELEPADITLKAESDTTTASPKAPRR